MVRRSEGWQVKFRLPPSAADLEVWVEEDKRLLRVCWGGDHPCDVAIDLPSDVEAHSHYKAQRSKNHGTLCISFCGTDELATVAAAGELHAARSTPAACLDSGVAATVASEPAQNSATAASHTSRSLARLDPHAWRARAECARGAFGLAVVAQERIAAGSLMLLEPPLAAVSTADDAPESRSSFFNTSGACRGARRKIAPM